MQSFCQPPPEGITKECKLALAKFVLDSSASVRVDRGWLICLLSSPPVLVAATASTGDAACDVQLLRGCLPIGLAVSGCWQRDDSTAPLSICTTMWAESGATGACMHLGVTASGELTASMPVVLLPQSRLFSVSFSLAVAKAIEHGAVAALLLAHSSELVLPGNLCVSDLNTLKDTSAKSPVNVTLTCRVTVPADHPKPSPALIKAGGACRHDGQLQQHVHTVAAHLPPTMPLATLVLLAHAQAAAVSDKLQSARHEFLQFNLPGWAHRVNVCVRDAPSPSPPVDGDDDEEVVVIKPQDDKELHWLPQRLQLHALFGLPVSRPVFRTILSLNEASAAGASGKLVNVHEAVTRPSIPGSQFCMVHGKYEYYHYLQDKENDKGWGCAYRSLQSVWSWFQLQGYTSRPPPSIIDIQKAVVATGFRPKSLIGTKEWIGSIEVGAVLDQELNGCSHKILNLSSGSELDSYARDLVSHFTSVGTPITTGGGELAHTMLGICANLDTGEIRYLILDPHYTGADDEKSVVSCPHFMSHMSKHEAFILQVKGNGCRWVTKDFFDKRSFLNLCLPQPPHEQ